MALSDRQTSILSFLVMAGWSTGIGVAHWLEEPVNLTTRDLENLRRRGLVVHSDTADHWRAAPRAKKVLAGLDKRYIRE